MNRDRAPNEGTKTSFGQSHRTGWIIAAAALLAFVLALPAALLGQPASAVRLGIKALVSTGLAMEVALTTPAAIPAAPGPVWFLTTITTDLP